MQGAYATGFVLWVVTLGLLFVGPPDKLPLPPLPATVTVEDDDTTATAADTEATSEKPGCGSLCANKPYLQVHTQSAAACL